MKTKYIAISFFTLVIVAMVGVVVQWIVAPPTTPSLETPGLSAKLSGIVLAERKGGEIVATSFPSGASYVAVPNPRGVVHAISGPDAAGQIAYLEETNTIYTTKNQLHITAIGGVPDTVVFRSGLAGSPNYGEGGSFALSPKGGLVAIINISGEVQMPTELFATGQLEIWDVARKAKRSLSAHALDDGFAWMPDSRRLIFVDMSPNPTMRDYQDYEMKYKQWTSLPIAYMLDTVTGKKTKIGAGVWPVVSTNGKFVILDDNSRQPRQVNLATLKSQPLALVGRRDVILTQDGRLVVYGSSGAIETTQINTTKFQTLVPGVGVYNAKSYGRITPQNQKMLARATKVDLSK